MSERDKLEELRIKLNNLLDEYDAFLHYDNQREEIVIEHNNFAISIPVD